MLKATGGIDDVDRVRDGLGLDEEDGGARWQVRLADGSKRIVEARCRSLDVW